MTAARFFAFLLLSGTLLFLSGCGNEEDNTSENEVMEYMEVSLNQVLKEPINPTIEVSGTIVANEEATIASEATGTVDEILVKEGDIVEEGQVLMTLEANTNLYQVSYSAAIDAFNNAKNALSLTQQSAVQDEKNAQISVNQAQITVEQAEISYEAAQKSDTYTGKSTQAQTKVAKASVEIAEKDLEIAKTSLTQTQANEEKTKKNLLENAGIALSSAMVDFRSGITYVDEIVGVSDENKKTNDSFGKYLSAKDSSYINKIMVTWKPTYKAFEEIESKFLEFSKTPFEESDEAQMVNIMEEAISSAKDIRSIMRNTEEALKNSVTASDFPQSSLDSLKSTLRSYQVSLENNLSALSSSQQALSDFEIQSPQRIQNANLQVSIKESNLLSTKENLDQLENSGNLQVVSSTSQMQTSEKNLENAKQSLEAAQSTLTSVKAKNALSIQSAQSQYDSAKASIDQALVNLSKLTISAPMKGTITTISVDEGSTVSPGTSLLIVSDFRTLKLDADISVEESLKLQAGASASIIIDEYENEIEATLSNIFPSANSITRRVPIEISFENSMNIPANIFARANIKQEAIEILQAPLSALISQSPARIFTAKKISDSENLFTIEQKEVEIGKQYNDMVEIKNGLEEGEYIVSKKYIGLKNGDTITISPEEISTSFPESTEQ